MTLSTVCKLTKKLISFLRGVKLSIELQHLCCYTNNDVAIKIIRVECQSSGLILMIRKNALQSVCVCVYERKIKIV